jgi:hypothetical protein
MPVGLSFTSHPSEDLLEEHAFGRLPEERLAPPEERLLACPTCQKALDREFAGQGGSFRDRSQHPKQDAVTADLKVRGVTPVNQQGGSFGFHMLDPDGFPVQISGNNPA